MKGLRKLTRNCRGELKERGKVVETKEVELSLKKDLIGEQGQELRTKVTEIHSIDEVRVEKEWELKALPKKLMRRKKNDKHVEKERKFLG